MNYCRLFTLLLLPIMQMPFLHATITHHIKWDDAHHGTLHIHMQCGSEDALYKEYTQFSADQDALILGEYHTPEQSVLIYDPIFKENKAAFFNDVVFSVPFTLHTPVEQAHVCFTYYSKLAGCMQETYIPLYTHQDVLAQEPVQQLAAIDTAGVIEEQHDEATENNAVVEEDDSWYCSVSRVVEQTDTFGIRLLLVFLLGLLLSLTPCIYPMIPITVGILQGQGGSSFGRNLFMSLCYTAGVATTFACMGMFAAYTGALFGASMQHPLLLGGMVLLLAYFAGSMVGMYEMYIPTFLQPSGSIARSGSAVAAFIFGALSGTIASPCVSPGLALVLGMVTKLAHPLYGFLLLFAFGIGLSMPLMIIGTFSGSLNVLPRAGMWMVEVKRMFGFGMFGMCIYFLSSLVGTATTALLVAFLLLVIGLYYLYCTRVNRTMFMRVAAMMLGTGFIITSMVATYVAVRAWYNPEQCAILGFWTADYRCAHNQALHEHKKLLIKVEAPCCSLCRVINKKFFAQEAVQNLVRELYVPLVIDGSDTSDADIAMLVKQYSVVGFPTLLIVDPQDGRLIKKWTGDVHTKTVQEFMDLLRTFGQA